jgi:hypothetical protein
MRKPGTRAMAWLGLPAALLAGGAALAGRRAEGTGAGVDPAVLDGTGTSPGPLVPVPGHRHHERALGRQGHDEAS